VHNDRAGVTEEAAAPVHAAASYPNAISFTLNGAPVSVENPDPTTLLVDYLRSSEVGLTGTKLVCGEGGCGACTVLVTRVDPNTTQVVERAVNACLHPLCSVDGAAVTTVEATGSTRTSLSPVQQAMVTEAGTQCGFCTPGWVMNMEGLLRSGVPLTAQTIEDHFDGNLCRCTGMRPILNAMQTFAGTTPPTPPPPPTPPTPQPLHFSGSGYDWYRPLTIDDARAILYVGRATYATAKLVNGNTSIAIYKRDVENPQLLVDVSAIPELSGVDPEGVTVGGGVSLAELEEFLAARIAALPPTATAGLQALYDHLLRIANVQVRNVGTIAGNLVLTRQNAATGAPFASDLFTVLATLGATLGLVPSDPSKDIQAVPVLDLPDFDSMPGGYVLVWLNLPLTRPQEYVKTYKVARRVQNAHALVNAGFRVHFDGNGHVADASIVFGGIGGMPVAADVQPLIGQPWSWATWSLLEKAVEQTVAANIVPMPDGVSDQYRTNLALNLTLKFFVWLALQVNATIVQPTYASAGEDYVRPVSSGTTQLTSYPNEWPVGKAIVSLSSDIQTTGQAIYTQDLPPSAATLEAAYVYGEQLYANFDYSPLGGLAALVAAAQKQFPGVRDFVTVADVPVQSANLMGLGNDDPVFAAGTITAYGEPIGLVLADTLRTAQDAAAWIQQNGIAYTALQPVATTIDEALELPNNTGIFQDSPKQAPWLSHLDSIVRPGSDTAWLADPHTEPGRGFVTGLQVTGAQCHFYFETQSVLVVPGERDEVALYCSSQDLASCQRAVAAVLGVETAKVAVHVNRVGGGFGGKETRPPMFAAAAAVAAAKLQRPVRLALDRNTDMTMLGGRHPYEGRYWVSFDPDGTIQKWRMNFYSNGGNTYDVTFPVSDLAVLSADGNYMVDTFGVYATCCRTNRMTNTAMRSFGAIQCSLIVEDAIEQVAYSLKVLPEAVRWQNFYVDSDQNATQSTPYGQQLKYAIGRAVWKQLGESCDFGDRLQAVQQFNQQNRWRKQGISMIPIKYGVSYTFLTGNQGGALLTVCESDGTVVLATGGVEMGQGLDTKLVQIAAEILDIDISLIQPADTSTEVVPNASSTGASTGADLNGGAVKRAAADLKSRLQAWCAANQSNPLYQPFPDWQNDWSGSWTKIVADAYADRQDLSAQALYASPDLSEVGPTPSTNTTPFYYYSWSAACSQVEIDVLTGEVTILRSDILYDAGKSLNSLLDAGQIWGGFVQGIGNVTTEEMYYADNGQPISDGTWNYKPPCSKTIPVELNVTLLDYEKTNPVDDLPLDPYGIQSSKSTGEPPLVLANTVFFAIKHAVLAAREDAGLDGWFELQAPATVEQVQLACSAVPGPQP
jgi:xanthine dehydrogenase small subunit